MPRLSLITIIRMVILIRAALHPRTHGRDTAQDIYDYVMGPVDLLRKVMDLIKRMLGFIRRVLLHMLHDRGILWTLHYMLMWYELSKSAAQSIKTLKSAAQSIRMLMDR